MRKPLLLILTLGLLLGTIGFGIPLLKQEPQTGAVTALDPNTDQLQSVAFDAGLRLTLEVGNLELPFRFSMEGETTESPRRLHGRLRAGLKNVPLTMELYTEESGQQLLLYTGLPVGEKTHWLRHRESKPGLDLLDRKMLLNLLADMEPDGEGQTVRGVWGRRQKAAITVENIRTMLEGLMLLRPLEGAEEASDQLNRILDRMDPETRIPVTVILDSASGHLLELEMDLAEIAGEFLKRGPDRIRVPEFSFRLELTEHNRIGNIDIPEAARTAPEPGRPGTGISD